VSEIVSSGVVTLPAAWDPVAGRRFRGLSFWFDEPVAFELAALRRIIHEERDDDVRSVALMCFSAIVVSVSRQDSDTRYVRRDKNVKAGDAAALFARRLDAAARALKAFSSETKTSADVYQCDARALDYLDPGSVSLVVTSPPYPNAWSYHLYHQNRILWLDEDPWDFKASEIGHHRAYSAKDGSSAVDFERDMRMMFEGVAPALSADGHVVVVVGDSIVRGELVRNDETVTAAGVQAGLVPVALFNRVIDPRRKAFNPKIGKIRTEHVLVFRGA
jgi:site-specific DNA-methyltransferase (cytosine-N4-specific)